MKLDQVSNAAYFLQNHQGLLEGVGQYNVQGDTLTVFPCDTKENVAAWLKLGYVEKDFNDSGIGLFYIIYKPDGYSLTVKAVFSRQLVCERVKTGTKLVAAQPAKPAVEEHEEDVYEWRCPDSVLEVVKNV